MLHRIFIAINLPKEIKKELLEIQKRFSGIPAKWVKPENLHITLAFLGHIKTELLPEIFKETENVAKRHKSFSITLTKVRFEPEKKFPPRMIWVVGESSKELKALEKDLKNSLSKIPISQLEKETHGFSLHITLARIKKFEFRKLDLEEIPQVNEDLNLNFEVFSIDVMESHLKRSGPEYFCLKSFALTNNLDIN